MYDLANAKSENGAASKCNQCHTFFFSSHFFGTSTHQLLYMYTHTYIEISLYINRIRTAVRGDFTIWSHTQTTYAYHIAVALVLLDRKAQREHPLLLAATYPSISLYIYLQPPQCAPPSRLLDEQEQQFKLACSHPKVVNSILSSNHPQKKKRYL